MSFQHTNGFTLIEILVSMVLISLAATFSLTVLKSVSNQQIETRNNLQYVLATKSMKNAFDEYIYSVNLDSMNDGLIKSFYGGYNGQNSCNKYPQTSIGEVKLRRTLCDIAESLSAESQQYQNNYQNFKDVLLTVHKATKNNIQYFTVKANVHYLQQRNNVLFDRIFVTQIAKGKVVSQTANP